MCCWWQVWWGCLVCVFWLVRLRRVVRAFLDEVSLLSRRNNQVAVFQGLDYVFLVLEDGRKKLPKHVEQLLQLQINILPSCITLVLSYILTYDARKPKHKKKKHGISLLWFINEPWNWHILVSSLQIPSFIVPHVLVFSYPVFCILVDTHRNISWIIYGHGLLYLLPYTFSGYTLSTPTAADDLCTAEWPTYIANNITKWTMCSECVCVTWVMAMGFDHDKVIISISVWRDM